MPPYNRPFSAFQSYSWNRLVDTLLKFKASLAQATKSANARRIDQQCVSEIIAEMEWIMSVMKDPGQPENKRLDVVRKLQCAECFSLKIRRGPDDFTGTLGTVDQIHALVEGPDGSMIELAHVTFKTADGKGTMRHRLEDIRLKTEPWWFSPVEHKAPKK